MPLSEEVLMREGHALFAVLLADYFIPRGIICRVRFRGSPAHQFAGRGAAYVLLLECLTCHANSPKENACSPQAGLNKQGALCTLFDGSESCENLPELRGCQLRQVLYCRGNHIHFFFAPAFPAG